MSVPTVVLAEGRDRSLLRRHPWVFSGGVATVRGSPEAGDLVMIRTRDGRFMAWATFSPHSQLRARVLSFDEADVVDETFIATRLRQSIARREALEDITDAQRWVFAESDFLPGVIIDRYGEIAVCEITTVGAERQRSIIVETLLADPRISTVVERLDAPVRQHEGLEVSSDAVVHGAGVTATVVREHDLRLGVDVVRGHKTGSYLDQRDGRHVVRGLAAGARLLDVCSYTGGFAVAAGVGGAATLTLVDSSASALEVAEANLARHGLTADLVRADAFENLRARRGEQFDVIVCDPPKLAKGERDLQRATRAYKDLNLSAFRILAPGGHLVTFSCSGAVSDDLFQKVIAGAALDAGRNARIVGHLHQGSDHPVLLSFPEAAYLKGLVVRVD